MRDFTLKAYAKYLELIKSSGLPFYTFHEYMSLGQDQLPSKFCLVRHDVDRKPENALAMAKLEASMDVKATYYFRTKSNTFVPSIIKEVVSLGHEVGYHYESLSDADGNIEEAVKDFRHNLSRLRELVPITTCSMHGRPLKPFDNRDIWKVEANHKLLVGELKLLGEVYLDIDYLDIAYINDTGRNWTSGESNRRDKVESNIMADFTSQEELIKALKSGVHEKMVFQIHPERWSDKPVEWFLQLSKDYLINIAKWILGKRRS